MYGAIRLALEFNLRDYHRRFPDDIDGADLYGDIITAVKWVHETSPRTALYLVQSALANVVDGDGPTLEDAARCLRHSLTQGGRATRRMGPGGGRSLRHRRADRPLM